MGGVLDEDQVVAAADEEHPLYADVEVAAKGPEYRLPPGARFQDKDGVWRNYIRVKWWASEASTWNDVAASVPDLSQPPGEAAPPELMRRTYSRSAKPAFFGHYWLTGTPVLQAPNALCLDYSAGKDGPLVSYSIDGAHTELNLEYLLEHPRSP